MKRNEIVEKLMSEGFSQNTLVNMCDKQLGLLSSRFLGEQTAAFIPTNVNSPKVKVNTKDPNVKRKVTDANKAGLTPELEESALKGLGNPKKVEPKESAMPGLSKPKKVEPKESAMPGLSNPKKVEPKEEALKGLGNPRKVEPKESAMPGLSNPKKQEPKEEALKGLGNPRKVEPKEEALKGLGNPRKVEPKESAMPGLSNPKKVEPKESAMPGLSKPKKVEPKESAMPGLSNPKKVEPKECDAKEDANFYDMTGDSKDKKKKSVLEKEVDEGKKNWIKDAIKKPGQLHKDLGVPKDEKIPTKKLNTAAEKGGKVGERARLAKTLKGLHEDKKEIKEWVESLVENDYHCITTKSEIMELIETKLMEQSPDVDVPVKEPKTRPNEKPGVGKPDTGKPLHNPWKKDLPNVQPGPKFNTEPDVDVPVKEPKTTPTEKPGVGKPDTGKPLHNPWKKDLPNVQPGPKFRGEPMPNFLSKDSIMGAIKQNQVNEISSRILQSIKNGKKNI